MKRIAERLRLPADPRDRKYLRYLLGGAYIAMALLLFFTTQMKGLFLPGTYMDLEPGDTAREDLILQRDFSYVDQETTRLKREVSAEMVAPVFEIDTEVSDKVLKRYDLFRNLLLTRMVQTENNQEAAREINETLEGSVASEHLQLLRSREEPRQLLDDCRDILEEILRRGILKLPRKREELSGTGRVEIWRQGNEQITKISVPLDKAITLEKLPEAVEELFSSYGLTEDERDFLEHLVRYFLRENGFYDEETTRKNQLAARSDVEPVMVELHEGDVVLREGYPVTGEDLQNLNALQRYYSRSNLAFVFGGALFLAVLLGSGILLLQTFRGKRWTSRQVWVIFMTFLFITFLAALMMERQRILPGWMPVSLFLPHVLFAGLLTQIKDEKAGLLYSFLAAMGVFLITRFGGFGFVFPFFSSLLTVYVILGASRRIDLLRAGLFISLGNGLLTLTAGLILGFSRQQIGPSVLIAAANGMIMNSLNLAVLPLFEHFLNIPTRFSLRELTDVNTPILKKMMSHAPGTFSHSVNVANLAQSACEDIGADGLLARIGSYYHDIGKIEQAEYFTENQKADNKHDDLKPTLSAAVIRSHVKTGVDKARELGLPKSVVDIVAQHHGKSVMAYFYDKAQKSGGVDQTNAEDFSYPGPAPQTKEAAVVMLADAVEAATRTLKKPTYSRLEKYVWNLITNRFREGALSECDLTFRDLDIIKNTFVQVLAGYFHTRVEYPDQKKERDTKEERGKGGAVNG